MIQLNDELFLLPQNEMIQGSFELSTDILYQHTFAAWVQFMDIGKITRVNLGVLSQWEDEGVLERVKIEDKARNIFYAQIDALAEVKENYYYITPYLIDRVVDTLGRQEIYFFDYFRKENLFANGRALLYTAYYGNFIDNMFGVPIHFVRQKGRNYYFVQQFRGHIIVPNIVSLENSARIIETYVQKLNIPRVTLWQEFRRYVRKTFGVRIQYGKPETNYTNKKFTSKWRAKRK